MKLTRKSLTLLLPYVIGFIIPSSVFAQVNPNNPGTGTPVEITQPPGSISTVSSLISAGIQAAIVISGLLTFIYLVWGGLQWLTSGGDKAKYEEARGKITAAIIGLAIVAAAWAIMTLIGNFLGIDIFKFTIAPVSNFK